MDGRTRILGVVICGLAFLQIRPVVVRSWRVSGEEILPWRSAQPPRMEVNPLETDLDGDGNLERVIQNGTQVKIVRVCEEEKGSCGRANEDLWSSPPSWRIKQVLVTEVNRDGVPEITMLVWRPFKPWPIDRYIPHGGRIAEFHDRAGSSNHLVLLGWKKGALRELWAGSALVRPLRSLAAGDVNGDGFDELAAIESSYAEAQTAAGTNLSVWEWNGFGFTRLGRVSGIFREVGIARAGKDGYVILTQN